MRFGRLLFLVHALIGLGPARNNGPRLLALCSLLREPTLPPLEWEKGSLPLCISLYTPNRAILPVALPDVSSLHYSRRYS